MTIDRSELPADTVLALELSGLDQLAITEMAAATGQADPINVIRAALWCYAKHLDMRFPIDVFALRRRPARK